MFLMSRMLVPGSSYWNMGYGTNEKDVLNDSYGMENMHHLGRTIGLAWQGDSAASGELFRHSALRYGRIPRDAGEISTV